MAKVEVDVELNGAGFQTGLQRLRGGAERFAEEIDKKFSAGKIFSKFAEGLGVGGGFQLAEKASDLLKDHWKEAADSAATISDETAKQLDLTRQIIALNSSDSKKLSDLRKQRDELYAEAKDLGNFVTKFIPADAESGQSNQFVKVRGEISPEQAADAAKKTTAAHEIDLKIAELSKQMMESMVKDFFDPLDELSKKNGEEMIKLLDAVFGDLDAKSTSTFLGQLNRKTSKINYGESISADSLAKIGAGGNVNVIGPMNPLLQEARATNATLKQILQQVEAYAGTRPSAYKYGGADIIF